MPHYILQNAYYHLKLNPVVSTWSLRGPRPNAPLIRDAHLGVTTFRGRKKRRSLALWKDCTVSGPETVASPHGELRQLVLRSGPDRNGLQYLVEFALPEQHPLFLWRVRIEHGGKVPVRIGDIDLLKVGRRSPPNGDAGSRNQVLGDLRPYPQRGDLAFFSNGWQSWSHTGAYGELDRFHRTRLGFFAKPMWQNAGTPHPRQSGHFASDMFAVLGDRAYRTAILAGFLSQQYHFGSLEARFDPFSATLRMWANGDDVRLDPGASMETDWACIHFLHLDSPDPLGPYLDAVARQNPGPRMPEVGGEPSIPAGWCSWYHYFQDISEPIIRSNLQAAAEQRPGLPLEFIQIDDGFQTRVGDWFSFTEAFPAGPAPLAEAILAEGFTPGIWLAPFIVDRRSKLYADHPEWLLKNRWGCPVNAGFVWDRFTAALDLTHPDALAYACRAVHTAAHEWGFPYLKLDFLYAAALKGRYRDPTRTRAQVLRAGLEALSEAAGGETALLGCGCPLGSALGLFEAMRIDADVAPNWKPKMFGTHFFFEAETNFPAARNALQNTLTRTALHRRWWVNDPDCLLLRPDSELTLPEVQTLATAIALTGGSLLLSDDLSRLPPERLRIAQTLLPLIGECPEVLDWFDSPTPTRLQLDLEGPAGRWHLLALFNWRDEPAALDLNLGDFYLDTQRAYHAREFWSGALYRLEGGGQRFEAVPPHGCVLLASRAITSGAQYLGSDLHVSQGLEVIDFQRGQDSVSLDLERPGKAEGSVDLYLPQRPVSAALDETSIPWHEIAPDCYRFALKFDQRAHLHIHLEAAAS